MKGEEFSQMNADSIKGKLEELLRDIDTFIVNEVNYKLAKKEFLKYLYIAKEFEIDVKPFQDKYREIIKRREGK